MPKINIEGVAVGNTALPEMIARAVFTDYNYKPASTDQTLNVNMEFTIVEPEEYSGRKAFRTYNTKVKAVWALIQACKYMGVDPEKLEGKGNELELDDILPELRGSEAMLKITQRQYQGKPTNDVEVIDPTADVTTAAPTAW